MKNFNYIFILLLLFSIKINAQQQYRSCLDETARWSIIGEIMDLGIFSKELFVYGDTTINGTVYTKIWSEQSISDFEEANINWKKHIPDPFNQYSSPEVYIRESEDASLLYFLEIFYSFGDPKEHTREHLLVDLNLQEGDKFKVPEIWRPYAYDSLTVDSVYIENGLKHIRFNQTFFEPFEPIEEPYPKLSFIESIGPNTGFFTFANWQIVNCFQNRSLFYKNERLPWPCGYVDQEGGAIQSISSHDDYILQIEDDQIKIHFSKDENRQIAIYDISGRLHYREDFFSKKELIIPIAPFPKGIYLLKLYSKDNNQINIHKIIL